MGAFGSYSIPGFGNDGQIYFSVQQAFVYAPDHPIGKQSRSRQFFTVKIVRIVYRPTLAFASIGTILKFKYNPYRI